MFLHSVAIGNNDINDSKNDTKNDKIHNQTNRLKVSIKS